MTAADLFFGDLERTAMTLTFSRAALLKLGIGLAAKAEVAREDETLELRIQGMAHGGVSVNLRNRKGEDISRTNFGPKSAAVISE